MKKGLCTTLVAAQLMGVWLAVAQTNNDCPTKQQQSAIQASTIDPVLAPYTSLELNYRVSTQLQTKARMYFSAPQRNDFGVAIPELSLEYSF